MKVHPTAIVDPGAQLSADVEVGPYALIGDGVTLGARCRAGPHACLRGPLEMGEDCEVCYAVAIGHDPQIRGAAGPFGAARIGARNVFREFSQVPRSMHPEGATVIGHDCYFMAQSHVAHDCVVRDHVVVCNGVLLAGHVEVRDRAFLAGHCAMQQFVRVGEIAMIGGKSTVASDVPPFCTVVGARPCRITGLNKVGLRRAGISPEARRSLGAAHRTLFRSNLPLEERLAAVSVDCPEVEQLVAFLRGSKRGVIGFGPPRDRE
jgi:UDP-N-acetylglucosamine acyltransferase